MYNKNLIFRVAMFTLILVFATTAMFGSTFARYTWSSGPITDSVKVARFDFTVKDQDETEFTAEGSQINIFGEEDAQGNKLLQPGDSGDFQIVVVNTSDVTVEAEIDARMVGKEGETDLPNMLFKFDENAEYKPLDQMLAELNASETFKDITFPELNGSTTKAVTVYWKWIPADSDKLIPGNLILRMEVDATISQVD